MKEILYIVFVIGTAFVTASFFDASRYVLSEMEQKCRDANIEAEERGHEMRMQRERKM